MRENAQFRHLVRWELEWKAKTACHKEKVIAGKVVLVARGVICQALAGNGREWGTASCETFPFCRHQTTLYLPLFPAKNTLTRQSSARSRRGENKYRGWGEKTFSLVSRHGGDGPRAGVRGDTGVGEAGGWGSGGTGFAPYSTWWVN